MSLVTSENLFWLVIWWHAIAWLLRILLSFNKDRPAAQQAGRTTLWVQGFGDAALLLASGLIYITFGTFDLTELFRTIQSSPAPALWTGTVFEINSVTA